MSNKEIVYWKQRNSELISIDDMDINHLRNVLKMIVKNSNKHKEKAYKWFDSKSYLEQHSLSDKYFESRNPSLLTKEQVIECYNKEAKQFKLNGDMANEFNKTDIDYHEFESDLGHRFNDDESRGNQ